MCNLKDECCLEKWKFAKWKMPFNKMRLVYSLRSHWEVHVRRLLCEKSAFKKAFNCWISFEDLYLRPHRQHSRSSGWQKLYLNWWMISSLLIINCFNIFTYSTRISLAFSHFYYKINSSIENILFNFYLQSPASFPFFQYLPIIENQEN